MSFGCEVCRQPVTHYCAGLDVPMLGFCSMHAAEHEKECPHVRKGEACVTKSPLRTPDASEKGGANG